MSGPGRARTVHHSARADEHRPDLRWDPWDHRGFLLDARGNTSHAIDYVINMVKISAYTTNAETAAKALQWVIDFDVNNGTLRDQWIKTVTRYYNGCQEGWSCWSQRYASYNAGLQTVIDETGLPFWVVAPPDKVPAGYLDSVGCDSIGGWAQDPDTPGDPVDVHLYFDSIPGDANAKTIVIRADQDRQDLCAPLGSCDHAYEVAVPRSLLDGAQHTVHAYGINSSGGANPELAQSPMTFQCSAPAGPAGGVRRWVTNQDSFASWRFSTFYDIAHISDADLLAYPQGEDWPASPLLAQGDDGSPEVWAIDGSWRRHVLSMKDLNAWRFDTAEIEKWPPAQLSGYEEGNSWGSIPFLVQGSGPEVYVIDVVQSDGTGGSAGAGGATGAGGAAGSGGAAGEEGASDGGQNEAPGWPEVPDDAGGRPYYAANSESPDAWTCALRARPDASGWEWLVVLGGIAWLRSSRLQSTQNLVQRLRGAVHRRRRREQAPPLPSDVVDGRGDDLNAS